MSETINTVPTIPPKRPRKKYPRKKKVAVVPNTETVAALNEAQAIAAPKPPPAEPQKHPAHVIGEAIAQLLESDQAKAAYLFEMNDETSQHRIANLVAQVAKIYLTQSGTPYHAYRTKANSENNKQADAEAFNIKCDFDIMLTPTVGYWMQFVVNTPTAKVTVNY